MIVEKILNNNVVVSIDPKTKKLYSWVQELLLEEKLGKK